MITNNINNVPYDMKNARHVKLINILTSDKICLCFNRARTNLVRSEEDLMLYEKKCVLKNTL